MNEQSLDTLLPRALREAARQDLSEVAAVPCPQKAQRARAKMLDDPEKWRKNFLRPVWIKVLRAAACFVLVCSLSFAALYNFSPTVRAELTGWYMKVGENSVQYTFKGEYDGPLPEYVLSDVPEDAEFLEREEDQGWIAYLYLWRENYLIFEYRGMKDGAAVGAQALPEEELVVNGCEGWYYPAADETRNATVIWIDEENHLFFCLDARASKEEILHIAESVILSETSK